MKIQNIWAVGRNYREHAKELGNTVPKTPMIFLKSGSCAVHEDTPIELPKFSNDVHHEIEVALLLDDKLKPSHITLAIDFTARDVQTAAKNNGQPWTLAKSFKHACALGHWIPLVTLENLPFSLRVNGELRQSGNTSDMVFNSSTLVEYITQNFPVVPGDVVLTGTPSGVNQVKRGDVLEGEIPGLLQTKWTIKR